MPIHAAAGLNMGPGDPRFPARASSGGRISDAKDRHFDGGIGGDRRLSRAARPLSPNSAPSPTTRRPGAMASAGTSRRKTAPVGWRRRIAARIRAASFEFRPGAMACAIAIDGRLARRAMPGPPQSATRKRRRANLSALQDCQRSAPNRPMRSVVGERVQPPVTRASPYAAMSSSSSARVSTPSGRARASSTVKSVGAVDRQQDAPARPRLLQASAYSIDWRHSSGNSRARRRRR